MTIKSTSNLPNSKCNPRKRKKKRLKKLRES